MDRSEVDSLDNPSKEPSMETPQARTRTSLARDPLDGRVCQELCVHMHKDQAARLMSIR